MEKRINKIKDSLYEAEGLLELTALRQDKSKELLPLALKRIEEVREELLSLIEAEESDALYEMPEEEDLADEDFPEEIEEEEERDDSQRRAPLFCLNDRFRFRRAIFGGSDADFNAAMNKLATFDNYEEAEEYFINELGLDPQNEEVTDFMEIISNYFTK